MIDHLVRQWALNQDFLHGRMSFICGPRQVGKTTLGQKHLEQLNQARNYYNWDSLALRRRFAANPHFFIEDLAFSISPSQKLHLEERPWIVLDEIHKYPKWKNILKGYYDEWKNSLRFLVMGSARLDFFRRSGDSLVGRYFLFRMNPLHPNDLTGKVLDFASAWHPKLGTLFFEEPDKSFTQAATLLYEISGFPEPVSVGTREFYLRWKDNHISLVTGEELRDLTRSMSIQKQQTLVLLLPERVGAPLSLNSMKDILQCSPVTVKNWLEALEKVYMVFSVMPFAGKLKRSVLKEKKFYFWDWGIHEDPGKRFENFIAVQLQRAVSAWNEWGKGEYKLMYVRTRDGREMDFVIIERNRPCLAIECKWKDQTLSPAIMYLKERLGVTAAVQVIGIPGYLKQEGAGIFVAGYDRLLQLLP